MKITVRAWAALNYDPLSSAWVLRKWVRDGEISPAPEKVGREYYVEEAAIRIVPGRPPSLVDRLKAGGQR